MNRTIHINATDRRIVYFGDWEDGNDTVQSTGPSATFFLFFRGTGIKMYGTGLSISNLASLYLTLDANKTEILLNKTINNDTSPMYQADNMEDGDHQLSGSLVGRASLSDALFEIDYFEIENSSGDGFDLLSAGPTAQNVPTQAITVDNASSEIIYHNESTWTHDSNDISSYDRSTSYTRTIGDSLSYSFDGVAIWYYGAIGPAYGFFNVSIDGSTPQRLTAENNATLDQRLIWSDVSLGPGRHNLTLTHDDTRLNKTLNLDFFRILPEGGTSSSTSPVVLPTDVQPIGSTNQSQTNRVPLAVGLTLGLLALVVGALGRVWYRRRSIIPDLSPVSPYAVLPMSHAGLQSGLPRDGKGLPHTATTSSTPVDTDDPPMSSRESEFGPPPSYESPRHSWSVGVVQ